MNNNQSNFRENNLWEKIKTWINRNPTKISIIASLIVLIRFLKPENLFVSPQSIGESMKQDLLMGIFLPDIPALILSVIAIIFGWKAMKRNTQAIKRSKKGFIIGVMCLLLTVTDAGNIITTIASTMGTSLRVCAAVLFKGPEAGADFVGGMFEGINDGVEKTAKEGEFTLDAHVERTQNDAVGTKLRVVGTLTNNTSEDWTDIDLKFVLTDEEGNPKIIEAYGDTPQKVTADVGTLNAGETAEFVSSWYPGILESDYEGLTDFQITDFTYFVYTQNQDK